MCSLVFGEGSGSRLSIHDFTFKDSSRVAKRAVEVRSSYWAYKGSAERKHIDWREGVTFKAVHAIYVVNRTALSLASSRDFALSGCTCLSSPMELTSPHPFASSLEIYSHWLIFPLRCCPK